MYGIYDGLELDSVYDGLGVYTVQNQFNFDVGRLRSLGFTEDEIEILMYILNIGSKVNVNELVSYGVPYENAKRIKYMYDLCVKNIPINTVDDLCKHLKKMHGHIKKLTIYDLPVSKIREVPRKVFVHGIKDKTFSIYNSEDSNSVYDIVNITSNRIIVETDKKPVLKYKQPKLVEGVVEILELKDDKKVLVAFNKEYCKLCNRFVILASFRRPEFHHGLIEIICIEGSKLYVYAKSLGTRVRVDYRVSTQRVYDYGIYPRQIPCKLKKVGSQLYKYVCGVYATVYKPNEKFNIFAEGSNIVEEDEEIEIED